MGRLRVDKLRCDFSLGMIPMVAIGAVAYFAARWVLID